MLSCARQTLTGARCTRAPFTRCHALPRGARRLAHEGTVLEDFYAESMCAPSRASLLTGRFGFKHAASITNFGLFYSEEGTDLRYTMLPQHLRRLGYRTALIGKWHQGFHAPQLLPTSRGFDSFFGYAAGCEHSETQHACTAAHNCGPAPESGERRWFRPIDLWCDARPAYGRNGTANAAAFEAEARRVIAEHARGGGSGRNEGRRPLFLMVALQDPHSYYIVERRWASLYSHEWPLRNTWSGMVSRMDANVGGVVEALRKAEMWENTLFVFISDNGSPVSGWQPAGTNAPLRGGKSSLWEGGVRTVAVVAGGWLPTSRRGMKLRGLAHITDLYATFCSVAAGVGRGGHGCPHDNGPSPTDALDLSAWLRGAQRRSPRDFIVHGHQRLASGQAERLRATQVGSFWGALRVGDFKLLVGPQAQASWFGAFSPNATYDECVASTANATPAERVASPGNQSIKRVRARCLQRRGQAAHQATACEGAPCLYDVRADPGEHEDLAARLPQVVAALLTRFRALEADIHPPITVDEHPPRNRTLFCAAAGANAHFLAPWRDDAGYLAYGGTRAD